MVLHDSQTLNHYQYYFSSWFTLVLIGIQLIDLFIKIINIGILFIVGTSSNSNRDSPCLSGLDPFSPELCLLDPTRADLDGEFIEDLISSDAFAPLLRLSPLPNDRDYYFNLDDTEGVCDLFDVPLIM
ncbi:hypothetical protein SNE40_013209 [Patella caerulea]|uniref:Uncharacterized protein n=1 Tax=Patella caerulea TaxID=87958 RepID=A0AAN8JIV9_PATCE